MDDDLMKIYIIGPSGSGKTSLSKKLEQKYNIKAFELDCLVYDDENGHVRRSDEEIEELFDKIINKKSWIIEDVGRDKFNKGLEECDVIYYLNISKFRVYLRVIKCWFRQRMGKEKYSYPPTLFQFYDMLRVARLYYKTEKIKLDKLKKYNNKVIYLDYKELNKFF